MNLFSNYPAEVLILLFLIITFALSGFEKISDWRGNIDFIKNHFQKSPLKNNVPLLLTILLIIEIIASILMTNWRVSDLCIRIERNCFNGYRTFCGQFNFNACWPTFGKRLFRSDVFSCLFYHYTVRCIFTK